VKLSSSAAFEICISYFYCVSRALIIASGRGMLKSSGKAGRTALASIACSVASDRLLYLSVNIKPVGEIEPKFSLPPHYPWRFSLAGYIGLIFFPIPRFTFIPYLDCSVLRMQKDDCHLNKQPSVKTKISLVGRFLKILLTRTEALRGRNVHRLIFR
jgi:hypothetical protein